MRCPQCKSFYYGAKNCPDCAPSMLERRKVPADLTLEQAVKIFNRYGWGADGMELTDNVPSFALYHEQDIFPPFNLVVHEQEGLRRLLGILTVCDFRDENFKGFKRTDIDALVSGFNASYTSFKCFVLADVLVFVVSVPVMTGLSEIDMVYSIESDIGLIVKFVQESGLLGEIEEDGEKEPDEADNPKALFEVPQDRMYH